MEQLNGTVLGKKPSSQQLIQALETVDHEVWLQPWCRDERAQDIYDEWARRLCRWLHLPEQSLGYMTTMRKKSQQDASAPIKPRCFQRENVARKVQAHFAELQAIRRQQPADHLIAPRGHQLLRAIQRAPWAEWQVDWRPQEVPRNATWQDVEPLLHWAENQWDAVYENIKSASRHGLQHWKIKMVDHLEAGKAKPFSRWLKGLPSMPYIKDGAQLVTHPIKIGEVLTQHWQSVYCPEHLGGMNDEQLDFMTQHIPQVPWELQPLSAEELRATALSRRPTACGLDGVTLQLFQKLPIEAWDMLSTLLNKVELGDRWPSSLTCVSMTAIPKADSPAIVAPLKCRMIAVLPQLYRLWASTRAAQAATQWLPRVLSRQCYGGVRGKSAKTATAMDSLLWDAANACGVEYRATYLDASRCFDTLRYGDLLGVARRVGLSARVLAALGAFYADHERFVCVKGWLQPGMKTLRGIPQGCPLSVLMCALWGLTWTSRTDAIMKSYPGQISGCACYLDDFSLGCQQASCMEECLGWTVEHFKMWNVQLNMEKSAIVVAPSPEQLPQPDNARQDSHWDRKSSCRLLGLTTGWSDADSLLSQRWSKAKVVINRLSAISLSQRLYRKVCAMYVVPLLYGLEYVPKDQDILQVDKATWKGLWGTARCASNRNLASAVALKSHTVLAEGRACVEACKAIWQLASQEHTRPMLLQLWHSRVQPRRLGLWAACLKCLIKARFRLLEGGGYPR